ncbi:TetR family transcriptional regulator C-terminal domain-containing protein [Reinekea thalattae]|nr:TetR family transcriptional regulator C-terminal domain-containing protein [Reinekea thalattae]
MTTSRILPLAQQSTKPSSARIAMETNILRGAEKVFAEFGFHGSTMDRIADNVGISKQNLLYYYPSKERLYRTVLQNIVDLWLERMTFADEPSQSPEQIIANYVRGKLELSRDYPTASKVFAMEVIAGAPIIKDYLQTRLKPLFDKDIKLVRRWVRNKQLSSIKPEHLFFSIWAMTQTYADFSVQIELMMGKPKLEQKDFDHATEFLTTMILRGIVDPK